MFIVTPPDFYQILKNRHLLLDTNVFIDASGSPGEFAKFFNNLKDNGVTLVTLNAVAIEFTRGASTNIRYEEKNQYLNNIIDAYLPVNEEIYKNASKLVESYKEEGKDVSIVDFLLGGTLIKYGENISLMTKDVKDFPQNIFKLETFINLIKSKSIHNFGFYSYVD